MTKDLIFLIYAGEFLVESFINDESKYMNVPEHMMTGVKGAYKKICILNKGSTIGEEIAFD